MQSYKMRNIEDYIGKRYGYLTVVGKAPERHKFSNSFVFQCDCGNLIEELPGRVISGHRTSCGKCKYKRKTSVPEFDLSDYIGKKENLLTVIGIAEKGQKEKCWKLLCSCDCGGQAKLTPEQFRKGIIKSCGCLRKRGSRTVDNRSKHPLYGIWNQMMGRCYRENCKHHDLYGGRGITVCDEWKDFWEFVKWSDSVGGRPHGASIDRIDNNGNYCPNNCRWATQKQQNRNKSNNIYVEYNGVRKTLSEWADETGIKWHVLAHRYHRGWSVERMLTEPVHKK